MEGAGGIPSTGGAGEDPIDFYDRRFGRPGADHAPINPPNEQPPQQSVFRARGQQGAAP